MKTKRILIMLIGLLVLVGCGGTGGDGDGGDKGNEKPKVALLVGARGDLSFSDSSIRGVERAGKELDIDATIIEHGSETDKFEPTILDTADAGYDIIIATSTLMEYVQKHAPSYKNITWILTDAEVDYEAGDLSNVYSIIYSANEGSFLGGYLTAKLSETGTIGFLGGIEAPIINDFLVGYIQGAQAANPDIKVTASTIGNFNDSSKGKELSFAMHNQGADMIFNVAGGAGLGLIEAAAEKGFKVLGVDSDQAMIYDANDNTAYASTIPTSVLKNVDESLYRALSLYVKGELKIGETEVLGLAENGVGIAENKYYDEMVPEEIQEIIKEMTEKVKSGEIKVDTAYGKSIEEIQDLKDSVRP